MTQQPVPAIQHSPGVQNGQRQAFPAPRPVRQQGLSFLVQGPPKAGKSTIADSGPVPRLILDIEGTSRWTPSRKTDWDPSRQSPPVWDGSWDSCIVLVREARTISDVYRVLNSGRHPFNSLSMDSVTEMQQRVIDELVGNKKIERDQWGQLLRIITTVTRQFRDLIVHPVRPLWSVAFVAGTHLEQGKWRPLVQGQSKDFLPYYVDILGYVNANPDGSRDLLIGPHPTYETGERVGNRLPYYMRVAYPGRFDGWTIESMLQQVLSH